MFFSNFSTSRESRSVLTGAAEKLFISRGGPKMMDTGVEDVIAFRRIEWIFVLIWTRSGTADSKLA